MEDLWPSDFGTLTVTPPRMILREQADSLTKKTKGILEGVVTTSTHEKGFAHNFLIVVPLLDNYSYRLLVVTHGLELYPVELSADIIETLFHCNSEEEFKHQLGYVLQSQKTREVIKAILAQVDEGKENAAMVEAK